MRESADEPCTAATDISLSPAFGRAPSGTLSPQAWRGAQDSAGAPRKQLPLPACGERVGVRGCFRSFGRSFVPDAAVLQRRAGDQPLLCGHDVAVAVFQFEIAGAALQ